MVEIHENGVFLDYPKNKFLQKVYGLPPMDTPPGSLCLKAHSMP